MTYGLGQYGEALAAQYLLKKGYKILQSNFKCKIGEIDLIAQDKEVVVIVEVKTRSDLSYGMPYEAVNYHKQRKLLKIAQAYLLKRYRTVNVMARFDVLSIHKDPAGNEHIEHIINAF